MDLVHKDLGIFHGPHCHHDRIISGDTSHHFGEFQGIQCRRHCHGHAGYGLDHQNILCHVHGDKTVSEDADVFISLTHFKGHEGAGIGGALKNIGMGCGSRAGKMEMHCSGKPAVDQSLCVGCGACVRICAHDAPHITDGKAGIDENKCVGCGRCIGVCPKDAVNPTNWDASNLLNYRIAEYSKAVCQNRPCFHISLVCDVSPNCDCHPENDIPIIPDVGMFASFDPVALDMACADACNKQPVVHDSVLEEQMQHVHEKDHFHMVHPDTNWESCVEHAEKIGLGTRNYELVRI